MIAIYLGAGLTILWGITHLFPTRNVVAGFGEISPDNRHIITMEWLVEGVALIFTGVLVAGVTYLDPLSQVSQLVYLFVVLFLGVMALISLFTGFKVKMIPFKLCPLIFGLSAVLIVFGAFL